MYTKTFTITCLAVSGRKLPLTSHVVSFYEQIYSTNSRPQNIVLHMPAQRLRVDNLKT